MLLTNYRQLLGLLCVLVISASALSAQKDGPVYSIAKKAVVFDKAEKKHLDPKTGRAANYENPPLGIAGAAEFAFDEDRQTLAMCYPRASQIRLYSELASEGKGRLKTHVVTGSSPKSLVYKKGAKNSVYAVICDDGKSIELYNSNSLKQLKKIPVVGQPAQQLLAAGSSDSTIYVVLKDDSAAEASNLLRLNVDTFKLARCEIAGSEVVRIGRGAVLSSQGRFLYYATMHRNAFRCLELNESDSIFVPRGEVSADVFGGERLVCDANEKCVTVGADLYDAKLSGKLIRLGPKDDGRGYDQIYPMAVLAEHAMVASFKGEDLVFSSMNSGKIVGNHMVLERADRFRSGPSAFVLYVTKSKRMIYSLKGHIYATKWADFEIPEEAFMAVSLPLLPEIHAGMELRLPIETLGAPGKLTLDKAPAGMKIVGNELVWRPSADEIGRVSFEITNSDGKHTFVRSYETSVVRPFFSLSFRPLVAEVSPDGRYLLLVGREGSLEVFSDPTTRDVAAVIDMQERRLLATRALEFRVDKSAINADFVVLSSKNSSTLRVFRRSDLSPLLNRVFYGNLTGVDFVGQELCLLRSDKLRAFELPAWKAVRSHPALDAVPGSDHLHAVNGYAHPSQKKLSSPYFSGIGIYDRDSGKALSLGESVTINAPSYPQQVGGSKDDLTLPWGMRATLNKRTAWQRRDGTEEEGNQAEETRNRFLAMEKSALILKSVPLAVSVEFRAEESPEKGPGERSAGGYPRNLQVLVFRELISAREVASVVVDYLPETRSVNWFQGLPIYEFGGGVAYISGSSLYFVELPSLPTTDTPMPLHFTFDEGVTIVKADTKGQVQVNVGVNGNSARHEIGAPEWPAGVQPVKGKMAFSLDRSKLEAKILSEADSFVQYTIQKWQQKNNNKSPESTDVPQLTKVVLAGANLPLKTILPEASKSLLLPLSIHVQVVEAEKPLIVRSFGMLFEVTDAELKVAIEKAIGRLQPRPARSDEEIEKDIREQLRKAEEDKKD